MSDATPLDSLSDLRENIKGITSSAAFKVWEEQVMAQVNGRKNEILMEPIKSSESLYEHEFVKGECRGMLQAVLHWKLLLESIEVELARKIKEKPDVA